MANAFHIDEARLKAVALAHHLDLIVLFGSHAKQRAVSGQSDLDVAVRFATARYKRGKADVKLRTDLVSALQPVAKLNLSIINAQDSAHMFEVAYTGDVLYEGMPYIFTRFKIFAYGVYADEQKYREARERYLRAKQNG